MSLIPLLPSVMLAAALCPLTGADPIIVGDPQLPAITPVFDAAAASARLYVSADEGKTWLMAGEIRPSATEPAPAFRYRAPAEGAYLLVTPLTFVPGKGVDQPVPVSGQIPAGAVRIVVDTTPPIISIASLSAQLVDGSLQISLAWQATDAHFAPEPVTLEISGDDGRSFAVQRTLPAAGSIVVSATLAAGVERALVRLIARDRAGFMAHTPSTPVAVVKPVDPVAALTSAISSLPAPIATQGPTLNTGNAPAVNRPAANPGVVNRPTANNANTGNTDNAQGARPDIIAPNGGEVANVAEVETVRGGQEVEERYVLASRKTGEPVTAEATSQATQAPTAPPEDASFLTGKAATDLLTRARSHADAGSIVAALTDYVRLQSSDQGDVAVREEFALRRRLGDWNGLTTRMANLPLYLQHDDARIDAAVARLRNNNPGAAIQLVSRVGAAAPRAREAALILADALAASGERARAVKLWSTLAEGDDTVAQRARTSLGK